MPIRNPCLENVFVTTRATKVKQGLVENGLSIDNNQRNLIPKILERPISFEVLKEPNKEPQKIVPLNEPIYEKEDFDHDQDPIFVESFSQPFKSLSLKDSPILNELPINIPTPLPTFYKPPIKRVKIKESESNLSKRKAPYTMKLTIGMEPYNALANLDKIQPEIKMKQLLATSPKCRSDLSTSLVRKRIKLLELHEITIDFGAQATVEVIIDGTLIQGVLIDSGSKVNLMNFETIEELELTTITATPNILRMADQSRVKPLGMLIQILTTIGGIDYKIDYIVFKLNESISSYPILLGTGGHLFTHPW